MADIIDTPDILRPPQWRYILTQHAIADPHSTLDFLKPIDRMAYVACVVRRAEKWSKLGLPEKVKVRVDSKERKLIQQAFKLYEQNGIRAMRFMIEAMLLTDAGIPAVAAQLLMPKELIGVFHNMFFDVMRYKSDRKLIYAYVLPASFSRARMGNVWDIGWKLFAIDHGLDGLWRAMEGNMNQTELRRMFARQQCRLMEMSDCMLHSGSGPLSEMELAVMDSARKHWDLGLDNRMTESNAKTLAMESFFGELSVMVDATLKAAIPLPGKTSACPAAQDEVLLLPPDCLED